MTGRVRRIGPTPWGRAFAALATAIAVLGPLATAQRALGLNEPVSNQLVVLALGLTGALLGWSSLRWLRRGQPAVLQVSEERLELLVPGRPSEVVDRSAVGAVIVDGDEIWGSFCLVVHDDASRVLHRWEVRWPARRPPAVVKVLAAAGWPAAVGAELYDGRFLAQIEGQPPILRRPGSTG